MTNVISAVGTLYKVLNPAGTNGTLSVTPTTLGNALVAASFLASTTIHINSVSGGGVTTWTRLAGPWTDTPDVATLDLWLGVITSTGTSTITFTASSSLSATGDAFVAQEFTCGGPSTTVWAQDGTGGGQTNTSSTSVTFPTLTPSDINRAYVGYSGVANTGSTSGATSGYTVQLDGLNNPFIYNVNVANSAQSPVAVQSPAGTSGTVGALITATGSFATSAPAGDAAATATAYAPGLGGFPGSVSAAGVGNSPLPGVGALVRTYVRTTP